MTDAEADVEAARLTLVAMTEQPWLDQPPEVMRALDRIFRWLRRLASGDKALAKALDRETGRQVKLPDGFTTRGAKALKKAVERRSKNRRPADRRDGGREPAAGSEPAAW